MNSTSIELQPDIEKGLVALAEKLHQSKDWIANEAIREYISQKSLEVTRWQETLAALEMIEQGNVVSGDAVHEWMRSWGSENELEPPSVGQ